jgi:hypothetical protein
MLGRNLTWDVKEKDSSERASFFALEAAARA